MISRKNLGDSKILNFHYVFSTALSKAALDGNIEVVKYLIDQGSDPKAGKIPTYDVVSMYGKQEIAEYLKSLKIIWSLNVIQMISRNNSK